ncbi:MAG TPA: RNA polymerase sigma-70 factor [Chitinophaga sp.]|uniref:RNA polymerase sigma factor n=1 Tax=Chitinophaga sp. TaxID=1869181 RepID=UPI002B93F0F2|nr:RNA polymerase sigma-70 factor [Chitinophaga sp.]HVI48526.1 RNA polymerase sigma-70 factor [Chitinophaga sp.]
MIDESLLLEQLAAGDRGAYTALYKYYQPRLFRYLMPFTGNTPGMAEEITQDIFVKVWFRRETFAGLQSFEFYLYRMARNRLIDIFRQEKKRKLLDGELKELEQHDYDPEDELKYREYHQLARTAISLLPERRKQIFELSTQHDLSWAEIASHLNITTAVVKKQLHLASRFIRDYIRQYGDMAVAILVLLMLM